MQPLNISGLHLCPVGGVCAHTYVWPYVSVQKTRACTCNLRAVCSESHSPAGAPLAASSPLGPHCRAGCGQREQTSLKASLAQRHKDNWPPASRQHLLLRPLQGSLAPAPPPFMTPPKSKMVSALPSQGVGATALWPWQDGGPGRDPIPSPCEQKARTVTMAPPCQGSSPPVTLESYLPHPRLAPSTRQWAGGGLCSAPKTRSRCHPSRPLHGCVCISKHLVASH